jgi:hypothetical protein
MWLLLIATLCAGVFAGAAIYVSAVEHPARMSCGTELAVHEFRPSYHRGAFMQASLATIGPIAGLAAGWVQGNASVMVWAAVWFALVPFTLIVIFPVNKQLLDPRLDAGSDQAASLLARWGHLQVIRTAVGVATFVVFLFHLADL